MTALELPEAVPVAQPLLIPANELLSALKPPQWLVKGVIEQNTLGMIFGASGSGKSFVALSLAYALTTGQNWLGHEVRRTGGVVYVAGEGFSGVVRRLKALEQHHGTHLSSSLQVSRTAVNFFDIGEFETLTREIEALPEPPAMIVIDTLARATAGAEENSAQEMGAFIQQCDTLKNRFGCAVLLVHHSGHGASERARGSSVLKAAMDYELQVKKTDHGAVLSSTKMKDSEPMKAVVFGLHQVHLSGLTDDDGEPITSAVPVLNVDDQTPKGRRMTTNQRLGLESFMSAAKDGQAGLESWRESFYFKHTGDCETACKSEQEFGGNSVQI